MMTQVITLLMTSKVLVLFDSSVCSSPFYAGSASETGNRVGFGRGTEAERSVN